MNQTRRRVTKRSLTLVLRQKVNILSGHHGRKQVKKTQLSLFLSITIDTVVKRTEQLVTKSSSGPSLTLSTNTPKNTHTAQQP